MRSWEPAIETTRDIAAYGTEICTKAYERRPQGQIARQALPPTLEEPVRTWFEHCHGLRQIAEATGWQHHTIRGAISGALKKKLGLDVEATCTREVGHNKTGAKGSSTVYRIVG